jgi:hypothetical protein
MSLSEELKHNKIVDSGSYNTPLLIGENVKYYLMIPKIYDLKL